MPRIAYVDRRFSKRSAEMIDRANAIIANKQTEYKRLGSVINDARLAAESDDV